MRAPRPVAVSAVETMSTLGDAGSRVSGSRNTQAVMPMPTMGTLTRKIEPHQKWSRSQPPRIGPSGMPSAEAAETMPMALIRSWGSPNNEGRTAMASGMTSAPPTPMTQRAAITVGTPSASVPATEPARKTARPVMSIRRRPNRSPSRPAGSIRAANTTTYASAIHCCSPVVAPRSPAIVGSATLRIVMSKPRTSMLATSAPRAHQRRFMAYSFESCSQVTVTLKRW